MKEALSNLLTAIKAYRAAATTPGGNTKQADEWLRQAIKDAEQALEQ
jgi:hypothetical protein